MFHGSQQKIKSKLLEGIKNADSRIITVSGESGIGKNLVLRSTINELKNAKLIWLMGTCTQVTQLSPFGYFQDVLLNFFNINKSNFLIIDIRRIFYSNLQN